MKLRLFPVVRSPSGILFPWNIHRVPLDRLPILTQMDATKLGWLETHVSFQLSVRERTVAQNNNETDTDTIIDIKKSILAIFGGAAGLSRGSRSRVIGLQRYGDGACRSSDTLLFVSGIRFDLASHTLVCDAYVLTLDGALPPSIDPWICILFHGGVECVRVGAREMEAWKTLLPALAERCRTWTHAANCEYAAQGRIPLHLDVDAGDPLCSCGRGKDVDGMLRGGAPDLWRKLAPFVTRVAISPLFAVSYLERVLPTDPNRFETLERPAPSRAGSQRCSKCQKEASEAELRRCSRCKAAFYCSETCQKKHWKTHKPSCKNAE